MQVESLEDPLCLDTSDASDEDGPPRKASRANTGQLRSSKCLAHDEHRQVAQQDLGEVVKSLDGRSARATLRKLADNLESAAISRLLAQAVDHCPEKLSGALRESSAEARRQIRLMERACRARRFALVVAGCC